MDTQIASDTITIDDFKKIQMKVGTILTAEKVEWSDKLLKIEVDLGDEKRTVLSGISKFYTVEEVVGMQVIVVTNLQPRKIRDLESQGMILASEEGENVVLLSTHKKVANGSIVL